MLSVLVVTMPSLDIPDGLTNYPVFIFYKKKFKTCNDILHTNLLRTSALEASCVNKHKIPKTSYSLSLCSD
jgi:hypothetical protein